MLYVHGEGLLSNSDSYELLLDMTSIDTHLEIKMRSEWICIFQLVKLSDQRTYQTAFEIYDQLLLNGQMRLVWAAGVEMHSVTTLGADLPTHLPTWD